MQRDADTEDSDPLALGEVEEPQSDAVPDDAGDVDIFVSYRVRPDESLAGELKALLESAIDPRPRVFVSGLGGLRASADSYREQLRTAATRARAYVALITRASIDREWIFFEAGAAFGRGVFYAPVLVDVAASELPSTIGGYQAIGAKDQSRMLELIDDVARALRARPKSHFGQRYTRFFKAVDAYGKDPPDESLSGTALAIHLEKVGKRKESIELFNTLIEQAETAEVKANLSITKLVFTQGALKDLPDLLESQPSELRETAIWKLWMGVHEVNPLKAVKLLREAITGPLESFQKRWALTSLAHAEYELGHTSAATRRLLVGLSDDDRRLRAEAAQALAFQLEGISDTAKLVLLIESTLDPTLDHLTAAARHCWGKDVTSIALQLASVAVAKSNSGTAFLQRGIARAEAGLHSLAFSDYRIAAQSGISVAKSNMAWMLNNGPVPEAGLEILREHTGQFEAADPGSPYEARALLERSVEAERARERQLCASGDRAIKAIHRMLDAWRREATARPRHIRWIAMSRAGRIELDLEPMRMTCDGRPLEIASVHPMNDLFVANGGHNPRILILLREVPEAVAFANLKEGGAVEWLELRPLEFESALIATEHALDASLPVPMLGPGAIPLAP